MCSYLYLAIAAATCIGMCYSYVTCLTFWIAVLHKHYRGLCNLHLLLTPSSFEIHILVNSYIYEQIFSQIFASISTFLLQVYSDFIDATKQYSKRFYNGLWVKHSLLLFIC